MYTILYLYTLERKEYIIGELQVDNRLMLGVSMSDISIDEGDWIAIYFSNNRKYIVQVRKNKFLHTNEGTIDLSNLIGIRYGSKGITNIGEEFTITRPSIIDMYDVFRRVTQVIYPKDASQIVVLAGIGPGSRVVEAGTGSGFLTALLAFYVRPSGRVYSYEIREDVQKVAMENIEKIGLTPYVTFKRKDVRKQIDEENIDAVIFDLPDPWNALINAWNSLKNGGRLVCFLPTINQVEKVVTEMMYRGFLKIETKEILERAYKVKKGETRPETIGVIHTGYIVCGIKP